MKKFKVRSALGRHSLLAGPAMIGMLAGLPSQALAQDVLAADTVGTDESSEDEIVVTGTSIRGAKQPTGSGLVTLGRAEIERSSASNTAELLSQVPVVNSFNAQPRVGDTGASQSTAPGLRGLPSSATLILLNGHRLVGDTPLGTAPDPSSIPPGAIERIEIVADGTSAVYGSDAVAGVINIITRKRFDGLSLTGRYGVAADYSAFDLNGVGGATWGSGSLTVAGSYSGNGHLANNERDFFRQDKTAFGGGDNRDTFCSPPNVTIAGTIYAPPGYAVGPKVKCSPLGFADILSHSRRWSVLATAEQDVTPGIRLFADFKYTDTRTITDRPMPATSLVIASTNPFYFRPPGYVGSDPETIDWSAAGTFTRNPQYRYKTTAGGATVGGEIDITTDWHLTVTGSYGWSDSTALNETFNPTALANAAAGTTTATALDPFQFRTNPSVVSAIQDFGLAFISSQALADVSAKLDGSLFDLPGGAVKVAVGGAYRHEEYDARNPAGVISTLSGGASASARRNVASAFGELLVPLVGPNMEVPIIYSLELSGAVRYDHYNDFGSTTNPKLGLRWEVVNGFALRGSYGKSFHAPSLADTQSVDTRAIFFASFPFSPPGVGAVNTIALAGGSPTLQPERATTWSAGFDVNPPGLPGFNANATYYDVAYKDQVLSLINFFPFPLFTDPNLIALAITLNPSPAQVQAITCCQVLQGFPAVLPTIGQILDLRRANLSATLTRGIDFQTSYRWGGAGGRWHVALSGVHTLDYLIQASPGGTTVDQFTGGRGSIRWRARAEIGWAKGPLQLNAAVNYTGPYDLSYTNATGVTAIQEVESYKTVAVGANLDLPFLKGTSLMVNIDNLFDEDPPLVLGSLFGYDNSRTNPIGRMLWLGVRQKF